MGRLSNLRIVDPVLTGLAIGWSNAQLIGDQGKLWQYASTLMSNNCTGCHGLTALDHFNANQWIGVIKGMESRTSLTPEQARMLTQYVQKHASDMNAAH